jgi:thiol-disulfide isomerase/thioredoxin
MVEFKPTNMKKFLYAPMGVAAICQHFYDLEEATLTEAAAELGENFQEWIVDKFKLSPTQLDYLNNIQVDAHKFMAVNTSSVLKNRLPILLGKPEVSALFDSKITKPESNLSTELFPRTKTVRASLCPKKSKTIKMTMFKFPGQRKQFLPMLIVFTVLTQSLSSSFAQSKPLTITKSDSISPLKVGDKVPEIFWNFQHVVYQNGKVNNQTLSVAKGKIIILDFWASWCAPCVRGFEPLAKLQAKYANSLVVMGVNTIVTRDNFERVNRLFTGQMPPFKTFDHATIISDTYLKSLFPMRAIPYYIWIDATGRIVGITNGSFIGSTTVEELINQTKTSNK